MNRLQARALPFGIALAALLVGGCSLAKPYPAKQTYVVEARRAGEARAASSPAVLRVRSLQIAAPFEGKSFVYRTSELGYRTDFYREFLVSPRALLTGQTRQWLGASGLFRLVLDAASRTDATHSLEGNVTALYGDYRDGSASKAVLAMEFFLSNDQSAAPEIIFHKIYRQEFPLENRAPETLAKGWGMALQQILGALEQDLATASIK